MFTLAAIHLVLLHSVDGRQILINPDQVSSVQGTHETEDDLLTNKVNCVVGMTNGKFISVAEFCDEVRQKLEQAK